MPPPSSPIHSSKRSLGTKCQTSISVIGIQRISDQLEDRVSFSHFVRQKRNRSVSPLRHRRGNQGGHHQRMVKANITYLCKTVTAQMKKCQRLTVRLHQLKIIIKCCGFQTNITAVRTRYFQLKRKV
jgi:hypothetical protein